MYSQKPGGTGDSEGDYPPLKQMPRGGELKKRFDLLRDRFVNSFDREPEIYVRVPGRVNLIGEHIDYCGFSVCPMAIQQDILVAAAPSDCSDFLKLINTDFGKYRDFACKTKDFEIDLTESDWASYFLCGVSGAREILETSNSDHPLTGLLVAVSGNIPPGAGLSSSSALVSSAFLTMLHINKMGMKKEELAGRCAESERLIGTAGGGMDQAIAFLATKGCAKHIMFSPIRTENVVLPNGAVFVIAHSMITMNKAATSDFNTRVVECRLAAQVLAKKNSLEWKLLLKLADVHSAMGLPLKEMISVIEETFHNSPYTKGEICSELGVTEEELNKLSLTSNTIHIRRFNLRQRALHVFQEAWRVKEFKSGCERCASLEELGSLMFESHRSLSELYECSHPMLDRLVKTCRDAGAYGARLTGAGWGGCVVALTNQSKVQHFIEKVKTNFYVGYEGDQKPIIFATEPGQGAQIFFSDEIANGK